VIKSRRGKNAGLSPVILEQHEEFYWENWTRYNAGDLGLDGRVILK
jgi:hypothetical protein